jgi:hypothetical protein
MFVMMDFNMSTDRRRGRGSSPHLSEFADPDSQPGPKNIKFRLADLDGIYPYRHGVVHIAACIQYGSDLQFQQVADPEARDPERNAKKARKSRNILPAVLSIEMVSRCLFSGRFGMFRFHQMFLIAESGNQ